MKVECPRWTAALPGWLYPPRWPHGKPDLQLFLRRTPKILKHKYTKVQPSKMLKHKYTSVKSALNYRRKKHIYAQSRCISHQLENKLQNYEREWQAYCKQRVQNTNLPANIQKHGADKHNLRASCSWSAQLANAASYSLTPPCRSVSQCWWIEISSV